MLKKILSYAVKERLLDVSPFQLTLKDEKLDYHTLSLDEIKYPYGALKVTDKRIEQIRDMFCLQSMTGLSFSDMVSLCKDDVQDDVIIKRRKKTDIQFVIPVLPIRRKKYLKSTITNYQ